MYSRLSENRRFNCALHNVEERRSLVIQTAEWQAYCMRDAKLWNILHGAILLSAQHDPALFGRKTGTNGSVGGDKTGSIPPESVAYCESVQTI